MVPPADAARAASNPAAELLAILRRGIWTILVVLVVVSGVVIVGTLRTPPVYEAESSLLVRIGREYVYRPEVGRTETARTPALSEIVNSEVEILSSRDLAEQVVKEIGVQKLYPEVLEAEGDSALADERAVLRFRQAASIRPVLESSVIKVGFEHAVPAIAADAVNLLVEHFKDKHVEVFGEERSRRLVEELQKRREELSRSEEALAEFKRTSGVFDLDEQRRLLLGQRVKKEEELQACEFELAALRLRVPPDGQPSLENPAPALPPDLRPEMKDEVLRQRGELERELRELEPPIADHLIEEASLRMLDLELEERKLLRDYAESSREVQNVRAEIEHVKGFLLDAQRRAGAFDEARRVQRETRSQELRADIARLTGQLEILVREEERRAREEDRLHLQALEMQEREQRADLAGLERQIQELDPREKILRQLERERGAAEQAVQSYAERADEARIGEELDREKQINVRVIEKASAPVEPSGLSRSLKMALGVFVGLLCGLGLAVLQDLFRSR